MSIEISLTGKSIDEDFQELKNRVEVILAIFNPFHVHLLLFFNITHLGGLRTGLIGKAFKLSNLQ